MTATTASTSRREASPPTDGCLMSACLDGDAMAWERLVDRYGALVYSVIGQYPLSEDDAAGVFEHVWDDAWGELERLQGRDRLGPWLIAVAGRLALGASERRAPRGGRRAAHPPVADSAGPLTPRRRSAR